MMLIRSRNGKLTLDFGAERDIEIWEAKDDGWALVHISTEQSAMDCIKDAVVRGRNAPERMAK